jgi:acyl carrier protein
MTDHESTITERVRRIVANHQGVAEDEIADDTPLFRNLASLDMEELIMAFEDEFGCRIPDGDAAGFHTVGDAIRFLQENDRTE